MDTALETSKEFVSKNKDYALLKCSYGFKVVRRDQMGDRHEEFFDQIWNVELNCWDAN